ncbi:MAG: cellulose synthase/poly-beta-1,6-N-acetylglucosamine synthase-like glycosyltransferase [Marinoscillum sp.]|jgi:cellulose synthase/poly-beta-1,6-N-acetylglucosamine synthase-like glycosyltransferase
MDWIIIIAYSFALLIICIFSFEQLHLAITYRKHMGSEVEIPLINFPKVTVQLPVYNEKYVIERLINSICELDYPKDKLEVQVLDDSTDESAVLAAKCVDKWKSRGINILHIRRPDRTGFKAGALQYGMKKALGDYIAIFDADFLPKKDFLLKTLPAFKDGIGMVQTRWGHINQDYSILTRMQAFGLNAHFTVEQKGRNASGKFMNFNGTAGIWDKRCIVDAGGWEHDTLTEDLDLSYRAQLKGWKFVYMEDVISPAELPMIVTAIKSQQYRWNKGAAETARKNFWKIIKSKLRLKVKIHALLHLFNSSVFLFLMVGSILSVPLLFVKDSRPDLRLVFDGASIFILGFLAMMIFYWIASKASQENFSPKYYFTHFPVFLTFTMGLALHNAIAVTEGYLGIKTPFIRTPKFNIQHKGEIWSGNAYLKNSFSWITICEGLLAVYFAYGIVSGIQLGDYGLILFHLMLAIGFGSVFVMTVKPIPSNVAAG